MRSFYLILFYAALSVAIVFNTGKPDGNQFKDDRCGYYLYLPATFIYHDLSRFSFFDSLDYKYGESFGMKYAFHSINGNKLNKYSIGVAFFDLPFFFVAHSCCIITHQYPADGFSMPYQLGGLFGNIFWVIAGLLVLRKFLLRYFDDKVVALALLCIALGTNLYEYTAFDTGMSHPVSFFLFASLLCVSDGLDRKRKYSLGVYAVLLGFILGLIFIVRPINIVAIICPLLWGVRNRRSIGRRIKAAVNLKYIVPFGLVFFLVLFPQLLYWHYMTGQWVYYSYQGEGFDFLHPHIWRGLFSYRKGWFIYSPMVLLAFAGFISLWRKDRTLVPALAVFFPVMIYAVFSWREWWYGGGFGCRPLIEALSFISLPLAALIEQVQSLVAKSKRSFFYLVVAVLISLNIFQTYQYWMGVIHWSRMTGRSYWYVFGKLNIDRALNETFLIGEANQSDPEQ